MALSLLSTPPGRAMVVFLLLSRVPPWTAVTAAAAAAAAQLPPRSDMKGIICVGIITWESSVGAERRFRVFLMACEKIRGITRHRNARLRRATSDETREGYWWALQAGAPLTHHKVPTCL